MNAGIMVAPNGARLLQDEHEALPLGQEHIASTAYECEQAGAQAIHLHVRADNFKHILDVKKYKDTTNAIKKRCSKDFIIQATTEAVGMYEATEMIALIKELKPQATSVAIRELILNDTKKELQAAKDFYSFARRENIGVQHILYSPDDVKRFANLLEKEVIQGDKHSILFVLGRYSKDQRCDAKGLIPYLQSLKDLSLEKDVHWMLCAFGEMEIPSLLAASVLGGHNRIGFENSRMKPNKSRALSNQNQVQYLKTQLEALNIQKVKNSKMREILGIFK